ncbi:MAG: hypothetical protein IPJ48_17870 [Propionivibrio sp.]|uniref:Uncharacterized protein n=1 Tax=Candidatus Propionivibrio dominans TaxID=2954373 RepID=A0A9D7FEB3_9RHOO|nr:hypothetical protein [Candidatus Propionivibrio dominans]
MSAERNTLRALIEAFDDGLEIEVDRGSGWEPWQGNHYNKSWGFLIHYPGMKVGCQT